MMPSLTIIIPIYNESTAIGNGILEPVVKWILQRPGHTDLLLVDDGSMDGSIHAAMVALRDTSIPWHILMSHHGGKGHALVDGIKHAKGDRILLCDLDQATPIDEAIHLEMALDRGADLAIGSRGISRPGAPWTRRLLSVCQVAARRFLLNLPYVDTQCGFKMITHSAMSRILSHLVIYRSHDDAPIETGPCVSSGWDIEMLHIATYLGMRVDEIGVDWHHKPSGRVNFIRDAYRGMRDLLAVRQAHRNRMVQYAQAR